jgi:hypothetical protein
VGRPSWFRSWSRSGASGARTLRDSDVFVGFLCVYLLTASRTPPFGDAVPMWEAAQNLVRHGSFAIDMRWPVNAPAGPDGRYYPVAALLACLVHVPGALLQVALAALAPGRAAAFVAVTSQLGPLILGGLTPMLFFRLLKRLGYGVRPAASATLLLGLGTFVWVYAHRPYSEILQTVCFVFFLGSLFDAANPPRRTAFIRWGFSAALLVNSKNVFFVCLPGATIFLLMRLRDRSNFSARVFATAMGWACVGLAPGLIALGWYNHTRWGSVFDSGYGRVTTDFWRENIFVGLWGQFLSPGKSIFLYAPPLLLAAIGLRRLWTTRREVAIAIGLVVGPVVLLYARYLFWSGDWGWGPRYLVFALPALMIPVAELFPTERRLGPPMRAGVAATLVLGIAVQCLGNAFCWDDFINISRQAQQSWLGRPNTTGTVLAPYPCFSCFEEVYPTEWLPVMQPIEGHFWLLGHRLAGDDWRTAEADAPWKRYTSLPLDIRQSYDAAEIDWWPLGTEQGVWSPMLIILGLLALAIPIRPWIAALRVPPRPGDP